MMRCWQPLLWPRLLLWVRAESCVKDFETRQCSSPSVAQIQNSKREAIKRQYTMGAQGGFGVCFLSETLWVIWEALCLRVCVYTCHCSRMCVNPQRSKASNTPLHPPPPPLWLRGSGGLTFHSSDPLFRRANSHAGLEMCYVAGWDENQGQFQTKFMTPVLRVFLFLPTIYLPIHFGDPCGKQGHLHLKDVDYFKGSVTLSLIKCFCISLSSPLRVVAGIRIHLLCIT